MSYTDAGPARLLRMTDGYWLPVGPWLPPVEDDDMHTEELADGALIYWHLPSDIDAESGDVLLTRERALRLLGRCGPHHHAVAKLRRHMVTHYDQVFAEEWLSRRQVWSVRVLDDAERRRLWHAPSRQ
jgi:hypothetical protein